MSSHKLTLVWRGAWGRLLSLEPLSDPSDVWFIGLKVKVKEEKQRELKNLHLVSSQPFQGFLVGWTAIFFHNVINAHRRLATLMMDQEQVLP